MALSDAEIVYEVRRWQIAEELARGERAAEPTAEWLAMAAAQMAQIDPADRLTPEEGPPDA